MSLPDIDHLSLVAHRGSDTDSATDSGTDSGTESEISIDDEDKGKRRDKNPVGRAIKAIDEYLEANSPAYRELQELRAEGWGSAEADEFFAEKEGQDEEEREEANVRRNWQMRLIARDTQRDTEAFTIKSQKGYKSVLDLSAAPGAFLKIALKQNPTATAAAFILPEDEGGAAPMVEETKTVQALMQDITMLAADMGVCQKDIRKSHPAADDFIHSRVIGDACDYGLVICDNTIEPRWGIYDGSREHRRRLLTQLALGLEHLQDGGTMIVMLHKFERLQTLRLLHIFAEFSSVEIYKHRLWPGKLSSFYMIASKVRSTAVKARAAVEEWKREWKVVGLGSWKEWRGENARVAGFGDQGLQGTLEEFRPTLLDLGSSIWRIQVYALKAPQWKFPCNLSVLPSWRKRPHLLVVGRAVGEEEK